MTTIACHCGAVQIKFSDTSPRCTTECCCNDCYHRVRYLQQLGGPKILFTDDDNKQKVPLTASKWDNRFQILSGRDKLFCFKLTRSTLLLNIASSCCHTLLLVRHEGYDVHCVTTCDECPVFSSENHQHSPPLARWFTNQWDPADVAALPNKLTGIWVNPQTWSLTGDPGWEAVFEKQKACLDRPIPQDVIGETFDDTVESIGRNNILIVSDAETT